jgi:hypothetical protein
MVALVRQLVLQRAAIVTAIAGLGAFGASAFASMAHARLDSTVRVTAKCRTFTWHTVHVFRIRVEQAGRPDDHVGCSTARLVLRRDAMGRSTPGWVCRQGQGSSYLTVTCAAGNTVGWRIRAREQVDGGE